MSPKFPFDFSRREREALPRAPGSCPVCGGELAVERLGCAECDLHIEGFFRRSPFARLTPEQERFVLLFLRHRGTLKDMERELGISYPTVIARLKEILEALGLEARDWEEEAQEEAEAREEERRRRRREILEALRRGEISAEEAARRLRELR